MTAAYIPSPPDTYQMSETVQYTTLVIAVAVVAVVFYGIKFLWDDWAAHWSIEDAEADIAEAAEDLFADRDQHADDVRHDMQEARR